MKDEKSQSFQRPDQRKIAMQESGNQSEIRKTGKQSRRDFLKGSAVLAGAGLVAASAVPGVPTAAQGQSQTESSRQTKYHGYVSFQDDDKISIFTVEPATGKLAWQEDVAVDGGPAPLAIDPGKNFLYVGRRGSQEISSYRIDQSTGGLSFIGTAPLQGEPVYLATDRTGRFVLSAYYYQSTAAVHAVNSNGVASFPPVEWRYTAGGAHAIQTDPSNRFAFVPHIANRGPNAIFQFKFDENTGRLTPNAPPGTPRRNTWGPGTSAFTRPGTSYTSPTSREAASRLTIWIRRREH